MEEDEFNQAIELMHDGKSLREACRLIGRSKGWFYTRLEIGDADLVKQKKDQYTRAREAMLDAQAEELEEIGDKAAGAETAVEVAGLRLKSDNRKWLLSKLAPKKYGDKLAIGGADDLPPVAVTKIELVGF